MTAIRLHDVHKSYGDQKVLNGLDLEIEAGEVFALLGPNGAGKTTAVEIMEGYRKVDTGSVEVLGFDPCTGGGALRSRIGIVLQHTTSFERSTVAETVRLFASLFPDPLAIDEAIAAVGLTEQTDQITDTMSGGQRRRLDVACGLVGRPELLFLDEPTTGLDPEARRSMWQIVAELQAGGSTVLLTTHYLDEAEALADRIGILIDGRLRDVAEPSRLGGRDTSVAVVSFRRPESMTTLPEGFGCEDETMSVETTTPANLVATLARSHGELDGLTVRRSSLEDVYLRMVSEREVAR